MEEKISPTDPIPYVPHIGRPRKSTGSASAKRLHLRSSWRKASATLYQKKRAAKIAAFQSLFKEAT